MKSWDCTGPIERLGEAKEMEARAKAIRAKDLAETP